MKFNKKILDLNEGIKKEWIITNGIGGFCSSTIIGANTRRYHGLLIAPLDPPAKRNLIVSKLDETIVIGDESYNLYTNVCNNYISDGYKYLEEFEKDIFPVFKYNINGIKFEKKITMVYEENTTIVNYVIKNINDNAKMILAPIINFRDFHQMSTGNTFELEQENKKSKVKVKVNGNKKSVYMYIENAQYIEHDNDTFYNMHYLKEFERGFYPEENLVVPGRFEIKLEPNEVKEISFICSLEKSLDKINVKDTFKNEEKRIKKIIKKSELINENNSEEKNELLKDLIITSDSFIINRPKFGTHSLLAGFPWFLDWGRDTLISFEGIFLVQKRFDLAKEILLTFTKDIKKGLVPNGYSEKDNKPLYNSVDASLLLFEQVNKYLKYTDDYKFIQKNIYDKLINIIKNYSEGIDLCDNNIFVDDDNLLVSGTENTQNTWMDAKVADFPVTPRNGKAVEINALWYNALKTLENLAIKFEDNELAESCSIVSKKHKIAFNKYFYNENKKCLYDVINDEKVRPNQLFALSLTYPVLTLTGEKSRNVLKVCKDKLLTKYGLRTLSKDEKSYVGIYEGDSFKRDMSYHQGITWVWLLGLYNDSLINVINSTKEVKVRKELQEELDRFKLSVYNTFKKEINESDCIGSISELYDSKPPYKAGGACSQAWSVAEVLRIII